MQIPDLGDKTILFIRHGDYWPDANRSDIHQILTLLGQHQAKTAALWLKENQPDISVMWHSDLVRSRETANIIAQNYSRALTTKSSTRLNEFHIDRDGKIGVGGK